MPGGYGSKHNGVKIGVFWDGISVTGGTAKITDPHVNIDRDVNIADTSNTLSISGGSVDDDSWSNLNVGGSGEERIKTVVAQTVTLKYGSTVTYNFDASFSGVNYAGATLTASKSITFPARAYSKPAAPTSANATRYSATSESSVVKWVNNGTSGTDSAAPYTAIYVERLVDASTTWAQASLDLSSASVSWTDSSTLAGHRYKYRVVAKNSAGISTPSNETGWLYTTPLPPTDTTVTKSGANIIVGWVPSTTYYTGTEIVPNRGGTAAAAATVASPTATWTDTAVNAGVTQYYTVRHYISLVPLSTGGMQMLYSTSLVTDPVMLAGPPNKPVVTLSAAVIVATTTGLTVNWVHKPIDASAQTAAEVRYRDLAVPAVYTTVAKTTQTTHAYAAATFTNGKTYGVQVRTKGLDANFGAWSDELTFITSALPTATITSPAANAVIYSAAVTLGLTYSDPEGSAAQAWEILLYSPKGSATQVWPLPGEATTQPGTIHLTSFTIPYSLVDQGTYTVKARVQDAVGLWSPQVTRDFSVDFADPPKPVFTDGSCDYVNGTIELGFYIPTPLANETTATGVTVEREVTPNVWQPIIGFDPANPQTALVQVDTNMATNPSFETTSGTVEVRRNSLPQPTPAGASGWNANNPSLYTATYDPTGGRRSGAPLAPLAATANVGTERIIATGHGLRTGDGIIFNGSPPTGSPPIDVGTMYYVNVYDANEFYVCTSYDNAVAVPFVRIYLGVVVGTFTVTPVPTTGAKMFARNTTTPDYTIASSYAVGLLSWNAASRVAVVPGEVWTLSAYVRANIAFRASISVAFYNAEVQVGSTADSAVLFGSTGQWVRPSVTVTVPAGVTTMGIVSLSAQTQVNPTTGTEVAWMTDGLCEKVDTLGDFFSGSQASTDIDLTPSWVGTANASASVLRGSGVAWVGGEYGVVAISSTLWKKSGARSLRLIPVSTGAATYVLAAGSSTGMTGMGVTFVAGRTYTVIGTIRQSAAQTGTLWAYARALTMWANSTPGGPDNLLAASESSPNEPGAHEVRLTFTLPAGADKAYLLVTNGASKGNGEVWWDDLAIVEGAYTGPYFTSSRFTVVDPIPPLGVPVSYRAGTVSAIPTYNTSDKYTVDCTTAPDECTYPHGMTIFLNAGPDWSVQAKIIGDPAVSSPVEREKVLVTPVGRTSPIELIGVAVNETYSLSGVVARDTFVPTYMVKLGATRDHWTAIALEAAPICYRDPFGKRVFCSIGEVSTDWGITPVSAVSATLTRVSTGGGM